MYIIGHKRNTLDDIRLCINRTNGIEIDLHTLDDKTLVLSHSKPLNIHPIPKFIDALKLLNYYNFQPIILDLKCGHLDFIIDVLQALQHYCSPTVLSNIVISSFHNNVAKIVLESTSLAPKEISVGLSPIETFLFVACGVWPPFSRQKRVLILPKFFCTQRLVERSKRADMKIYAYTLNHEINFDQMNRIGIHGIIVDL